MITKPDWLPNMFSIGSISTDTFDELYNIFNTDFVIGRPKLDNLPVFWDQTIRNGNKYEEGFWHIIEKEDQKTKKRAFDPSRAEKLPWCAPSILNFNDTIIKYWEFKESEKKIKIYLWLEDFDYVIIFQKKQFKIGEIAFLLTAYHVENDYSKRKLQNRYENRI